MAFVLLISSVLSTEAVEAWRRDLGAMALGIHTQKGQIAHSATIARSPLQGGSDNGITHEGRPSRVATNVDDDFVDIPTFCGPNLVRPHVAPDMTPLPPHAVCWSEIAIAEAVTFLPDARGPPASLPSAPPSLRAPPIS